MPDDLARRLRNLYDTLLSGDIDKASYTHGLDRLCIEYGVAQVDELLQQMFAGSSTLSIKEAYINSNSIAETLESAVDYTNHGTFASPQFDPMLLVEKHGLRVYLQHVFNECYALSLGQIDLSNAGNVRPVKLSLVYVGLHTTKQIELNCGALPSDAQVGDQRLRRPLTALEAFSQVGTGRLILLGTPGSGKSTFMRHLALCLAGASMSLYCSNTLELTDSWLAQLPTWRYGTLLPVCLILRDLAAFDKLATASYGSVRLLEDYLATTLMKAGCADAWRPLMEALREGRALLLLDGLDEVVNDVLLARVTQCIEDAARSYSAPILITCRTLDYREEPQRQLSNFATSTLADLDDAQIEQFVQNWYTGLMVSGRRTPAQAIEHAQALRIAISECSALHALAGSPLLLTVMALVYTFKGRLPESRAQLYATCIEQLLLRWQQSNGAPNLLQQIELSHFRETDLRALIARLGFLAHQKAERQSGNRRSSDLSEDEVITILAREFARYMPQRKHALAVIVFQALAQGNGLLLKRSLTTYVFPHRTFQEFLAGQYLKGQQRNYLQLCSNLAPHPYWYEALLLMAGTQILADDEIERPLLLADQLLEHVPQAQVLAGELLVLISYERAVRYSMKDTRRIWPKAAQTLRQLVTNSHTSAASAALRVRAGLVLGQLCYGELKNLAMLGTRLFAPDPRLPLALIGTSFQDDRNWLRCLEHYWIPIASGSFYSGNDNSTDQLTSATIQYSYHIGRYPVTNADYACFLAANGPDGYEPEKPWWTSQGQTYLMSGGFRFPDEPEQISTPRFWTVARYNGPLQPVVGISWYEATAYCRWLTTVGHTNGWLLPSEVIRLPTWHEWERVARHTDTRRYPWGDALPDSERANYCATDLGVPTPIGCFSTGAAASGVQDMVGNVGEWTASPWHRWERWQEDVIWNEEITLSWTCFNTPADMLCCGVCDKGAPHCRYNDWGLRLVRSHALMQ